MFCSYLPCQIGVRFLGHTVCSHEYNYLSVFCVMKLNSATFINKYLQVNNYALFVSKLILYLVTLFFAFCNLLICLEGSNFYKLALRSFSSVFSFKQKCKVLCSFIHSLHLLSIYLSRQHSLSQAQLWNP